jgi:hypothetical protein
LVNFYIAHWIDIKCTFFLCQIESMISQSFSLYSMQLHGQMLCRQLTVW